jgi:signal transduction histidine kinase
LERLAVPQLALQVADGLSAQCAELVERWRARTRAAAPRGARALDAGEPGRGERLCTALVVALRGSARGKDHVMRIGWELGDLAHQSGGSLPDLLKEMELLSSILLHAAERLAADVPTATAADGIALARQLAGGTALLTLAAARGFMQAQLTDERRRFRALRHDLRNPLGSIKGAISLMEDPTVSVELRNDPRFRSMVSRNAAALELLIADRLSDAAATGVSFTRCDVSLHDVALAVRRDLRDLAAEAGCTVEVVGDLPVVRTDSTSFELALRSLVSDALQAAAPGATVHVQLRHLRDRAATLEITADAVRAGDEPGGDTPLGFARDLSALTGGRAWNEDGALCLEIPLLPGAEPRQDRSRAD